MLQDYSFGVFTSNSDAEALWRKGLYSAAHPDVFFQVYTASRNKKTCQDQTERNETPCCDSL